MSDAKTGCTGCLGLIILSWIIVLPIYFIFVDSSTSASKNANIVDTLITGFRTTDFNPDREKALKKAADNAADAMEKDYGIDPYLSIYKALKKNKLTTNVEVKELERVIASDAEVCHMLLTADHQSFGKINIYMLASDRSFWKVQLGDFLGIDRIVVNEKKVYSGTKEIVDFLITLYPGYKSR